MYRNIDEVVFHLQVEGSGRYRFLFVNPALYDVHGLRRSRSSASRKRVCIPNRAQSVAINAGLKSTADLMERRTYSDCLTGLPCLRAGYTATRRGGGEFTIICAAAHRRSMRGDPVCKRWLCHLSSAASRFVRTPTFASPPCRATQPRRRALLPADHRPSQRPNFRDARGITFAADPRARL